MPQNAVRRERPDLYKSFNPAERLDNNRSLGCARDLACGLPLGSRRSPHSRPQNGSTLQNFCFLFRGAYVFF
jgi:hypothetical protein